MKDTERKPQDDQDDPRDAGRIETPGEVASPTPPTALTSRQILDLVAGASSSNLRKTLDSITQADAAGRTLREMMDRMGQVDALTKTFEQFNQINAAGEAMRTVMDNIAQASAASRAMEAMFANQRQTMEVFEAFTRQSSVMKALESLTQHPTVAEMALDAFHQEQQRQRERTMEMMRRLVPPKPRTFTEAELEEAVWFSITVYLERALELTAQTALEFITDPDEASQFMETVQSRLNNLYQHPESDPGLTEKLRNGPEAYRNRGEEQDEPDA